MRMIFGGTDTGLVRQNNQDRFECTALSDTLSFAVLCDGIGGENGGEVAAETSVLFAADMLKRNLTENMSEISLRAITNSVFSGANALVHEKASDDQNLSGMGTTMIVAVLSGNTLYIAHVGDSRVYLLGQDSEKILTRDHTLVQMLLDSGKLTEEEALTHPKRNYLTRAVGIATNVDVEFQVYSLDDGDLVLLCSDGFYHYLEPGQLRSLMNSCVEAGNTNTMIAHAKAGGGGDNITVVVMG